MSFFAKGKKRQIQQNNKSNKIVNGKSSSSKHKEAEITSSESEFEDDGENIQSSEDEEETAQEKRLRLAKIYLQEIEKEEKDRLDDDDELDDNTISRRLKTDYLKQTGKYKSFVADGYSEVDQSSLVFLRCKEHKTTITCLCISADDKFIFSGSKDGSIVKWSISEKRKVGSLPFRKKNFVATNTEVTGHHSSITSIAISDNFKFLAVSDKSNEIQIWNPENLTHIHTFKHHRDTITGLSFRKGSNTLYSCSKDRSVKVWSLDEKSYLETLFGHQDTVMAIDALSRERAITAGGSDNTLRIWKIPEESQLIFNGNGSIDCVKLITEDHFITGGDAGEVCIWSSLHKKPLCSVKDAHGVNPLNNQPIWISAVGALVNTDLVATGSSDGFIRLWKVGKNHRTITPIVTIPVVGFVNSLHFTSDGKNLVAGIGQEHRMGRWEVIKEAKNAILIIPLNVN